MTNVLLKSVWPLAMIVLASLLEGCTPTPPEVPASDSMVNQPVDFVHHVHFEPSSAQLDQDQVDQLTDFVEEVDPDGRSEIVLDAAGPMAELRQSAVKRWLRKLQREPIADSAGVGSADGVAVTVRRTVLLPEACLGRDDGWPSPDLPPSGCTNALNLLSMVERPEDLLQGRPMGPSLAAPAIGAARRYYDWQSRPPVPTGAPDTR